MQVARIEVEKLFAAIIKVLTQEAYIRKVTAINLFTWLVGSKGQGYERGVYSYCVVS